MDILQPSTLEYKDLYMVKKMAVPHVKAEGGTDSQSRI